MKVLRVCRFITRDEVTGVSNDAMAEMLTVGSYSITDHGDSSALSFYFYEPRASVHVRAHCNFARICALPDKITE